VTHFGGDIDFGIGEGSEKPEKKTGKNGIRHISFVSQLFFARSGLETSHSKELRKLNKVSFIESQKSWISISKKFVLQGRGRFFSL
jgi:hypothetical protein